MTSTRQVARTWSRPARNEARECYGSTWADRCICARRSNRAGNPDRADTETLGRVACGPGLNLAEAEKNKPSAKMVYQRAWELLQDEFPEAASTFLKGIAGMPVFMEEFRHLSRHRSTPRGMGGTGALGVSFHPVPASNLPRNPGQFAMRSSFEQPLEGKSQAPSVTTLRLGAKLKPAGRTEYTGPAYPGLRSHWPELVYEWITRKWAVCAW
jgi:hypothetical protein